MKKIIHTVYPFVQLILAIVAFVFGGSCSSLYAGAYETSQSYGGDAYTGIQNAAAQTANNLRAVGNLISSCFQYVFIFVGLVLLVLALKGILELLPSILESLRNAAQMKPSTPAVKVIPAIPMAPTEAPASAPAEQPSEPVSPAEETPTEK